MDEGTIIWSPEAEDDLREIFAYIAQDSIYHAELMIERIHERCDTLPAQPLKGKKVKPQEERIREVREGKYRIIYHTMSLPDIEIVRIVHSARIFF